MEFKPPKFTREQLKAVKQLEGVLQALGELGVGVFIWSDQMHVFHEDVYNEHADNREFWKNCTVKLDSGICVMSGGDPL